MVGKLMLKAIHHQVGVLPSTTPAIRSEKQTILLWFATRAGRCNSSGAAHTFKLVGASAISAVLSPNDLKVDARGRLARRLDLPMDCPFWRSIPENSKASHN